MKTNLNLESDTRIASTFAESKMSTDHSASTQVENKDGQVQIDLHAQSQIINGYFHDPPFRILQDAVKRKALQQLALSDDSPFHDPTRAFNQFPPQHYNNLVHNQETHLDEETKLLREQLELVKRRLSELKLSAVQKETSVRREEQQIRKPEATSQDDNEKSKPKPEKEDKADTKFRPLTGKTDCPNCSCDRRSSICLQCKSLPSHRWSGGSMSNQGPPLDQTFAPVQKRAGDRYTAESYDDRPIRPARETNFKAVVEAIDDAVVPSRVFTISKSLDSKRTKLAQAIDDLQLMMDKVSARGDRLEQERKLVKLYKDQWKFGPNIGGPKASCRDRQAKTGSSSNKIIEQPARSYTSRLDANLSRDSNSLMGYQNIESNMKLRQYGNLRQPARGKNSQLIAKAETKRPWNSRQINKPPRSKSFESLQTITAKPKAIVRSSLIASTEKIPANLTNSQKRKSSSEVNLATSSLNLNDSIQEEEEDIEQDIEISCEDDEVSQPIQTEENRRSELPLSSNQPKSSTLGENIRRPPSTESRQVEKMTWVPVFGETEIKTVKSNGTRKVTIAEPKAHGPKSAPIQEKQTNLFAKSLHNSSTNPKKPILRPTNNSTTRRTLSEANKTLKNATNLLENERHDSKTKNRLIVNRTVPKLREKGCPTHERTAPTNNKLGDLNPGLEEQDSDETKRAKSLVMGANREIARLEEMIAEQKEILIAIANQSQQKTQYASSSVTSPITVRCTSPYNQQCVSIKTGQAGSVGVSQVATGSGGRSNLVSNLREKLNRTKLRLARTLEEEREKHQRLKLKFDSSLRKQSDLEHENELLKQSLGKCIDTCLRDISSTFESLNDSLTSSLVDATLDTHSDEIGVMGDSISTKGSVLSNAARLLADNRHLKRMKNHIETVESQRKVILDELGTERARNKELEMQLAANQSELNKLTEAKQKLESQLNNFARETKKNSLIETQVDSIADFKKTDVNESTSHTFTSDFQPSTSRGDPTSTRLDETATWSKSSELDESYNSVDVYRRFINSMSPDIESIRRERKLILSEFDNIKKILSHMDE